MKVKFRIPFLCPGTVFWTGAGAPQHSRWAVPRWLQTTVLLGAMALGWGARGQTPETVYAFQGAQGGTIYSPLLLKSDGNFYGTTLSGGANGRGMVFQLTPAGVMTVLYSFDSNHGAAPYAGLVEGQDGWLYGTTSDGGSFGGGTVFKVSTNGVLNTLVNFSSFLGLYPHGGLIQGPDGNFYGTTYGGYPRPDSGTIFRMTPTGTLTTLASFYGTNGAFPTTDLVLGSDGTLYGTTSQGGPDADGGVAFKLGTNGTLVTLASFVGTNGIYPSGLVLGQDGNLYGVTQEGGQTHGTVFRVTPQGALTTLAAFDGNNGELPMGKLLQAPDGTFYGTTYFGGQGSGNVFRLSPGGELTSLASLADTASSGPRAGVVLGPEGAFYGTTQSSTAYQGWGTVFRLTLPVVLTAARQGNQLVLSWPTNAAGFALQVTSDLREPLHWSDDTNAPARLGSNFVVTNSLAGGAGFYRLRKP